MVIELSSFLSKSIGRRCVENRRLIIQADGGDINGSNEIIEDGNNGLIVPVKNAVLLKVAMEKLISDDSFRKVMASNARQSIVENYQQETVWNAILKEYQQLLSNGIR